MADTISLPAETPTISQLPLWKAHLTQRVCQTVDTDDERQIRTWLRKVEKKAMSFKRLETCPTKSQRLDRKLAVELGKIMNSG